LLTEEKKMFTVRIETPAYGGMWEFPSKAEALDKISEFWQDAFDNENAEHFNGDPDVTLWEQIPLKVNIRAFEA
jgi:hypothetical protein